MPCQPHISIPRILIIAGSDSGGGAGIQADIKTVTMLGGHAMTAIAAITAQNTLGVTAVHPVPVDMVLAQIDAVASDIGVDAVKIGMIGSAQIAHAVADRLEALPDVPVLFDPVMIATSGSILADTATIAAFERLMRLAASSGRLGVTTAALGGRAAVLAHGCHLAEKGGHAEGDSVHDQLFAPDGALVAETVEPRFDTVHTHGTGCSFASALATGLGAGLPVADAFTRAVRYVRAAIRHAPGLGAGHGPIGHALGTVPFDRLAPNA
jgi:hydroxymethylpyrimidine/phosphomethylpyrimidine kinase